ncbi:low molecular weight protein-tyrosine-phosphatase [Pseudoalteromonas sp. SSDWG2]|uniref:low molecular weight protein-tyrosine-phosphatase n=1 Tax=Pseudoalteromonas sp. SSDWG2 TaxID=3139391 RepID=UPI003BA9DE71
MKIMFVCLGNICRSPTAHGIARHKAKTLGANNFTFASSGTAAYHVGEAPDKRACEHAKMYGYDLSDLRAQQLTADDFYEYDLILTMDDENFANAQAIKPQDAPAKLKRLLDYHPDETLSQVPDPYYGGAKGFVEVIEMCEIAIDALLEQYR